MRKCSACQHELDAEAIASGKCPNCGAALLKLAKRTIEDKRLLGPKGKETSEGISQLAPPDANVTDTDQPEATIELPGLSGDSQSLIVPPEASAPKSPTVADQSDRTMEFAPPESDEQPAGRGVRRSTHSLESDLTIDLDMSPEEARHVDSQWRGTFEHGVAQGQTIRQRETVTGFRSSLPVKSRYIRDKKKTGDQPVKSPADVPDYELLDIIGEGGMGVVYAAHQSSIARTVAVKMLKPSPKVREDQRDKFISEAVVTGELDHPNIVPIYDLGANDEGALFYSMKRVRGTPWDKVIHQKQLDENLSILLRVADAVAFAHAGGVIHRDLKPENVMLGDFGEVLVMDWGLARITPEFAHAAAVYQSDSLGGTPAYMAPEMAKGPVEAINKTSDIYLLGAILYEIIGGQPPHSGRDVMQCLMGASQNKIDPIRYEGELKEIALKAMATRQEDRYATVKDFQAALRVYLSHSESLVLTAHANQNLQKARAANDYALYARALYGFQESLTLWSENHRARRLLAETQRDYATSALEKGDFDLAASLLDDSQPEQAALLTRIDAARAERDARQRRLRYAKMAVAALLAGIIVTSTVAYFVVRGQRNRALVAEQQARAAKENEEDARLQAEQDRDAARLAKEQEEAARLVAEERRLAAEQARKNEELARIEEEKQRQAAEEARLAEEYESYVAQIGLASAKISENAYDSARELLDETKAELRDWEWGRLLHLSQLSAGAFPTGGPITAIAYSPDGQSLASGDFSGQLTVRDAANGQVRFQVPHGQYVLSVAYSPDGRQIATGSSDRTIKIIDAESGRVLDTLTGHRDGVLSVCYSPDGSRLLSGSYDNTARLWDLASRQTLQVFQGHSWWVWSAEFSPDARRIVTAGQDGKAIVWERQDGATADDALVANPPAEPPAGLYRRYTEFAGHDGAVYAAKFSPDGELVATGGYDRRVMLWDPDEVETIDIAQLLEGPADSANNHTALVGHDGPVRSVGFSPNGKLLLTGSEDNTVRVWDVESREAVKTLRGHGSSVRSCSFSPDGKWVVSGGDDQRIRLWDLKGYQETQVLHATVFAGHEDAVLAASYSPDGEKIVTASRDRTATLWDASSGQPLRRFEEGHEFLVTSAVFFPDGQRLATGAGDNSVRVWDATAGTQLFALSPTGRIGALAVSPDGRQIATGSNGTGVQLWDARDGKHITTLHGHVAEISSLAFSPSGKWLSSGDDRGHVRLWLRSGDDENITWQFERELSGHNGSITSMRFTPDEARLVTASGDRTCAQWDLATGEELRQLVLRHDDWVSSVDLTPDGKFALTTCDDRLARLWRLADAKLVAEVRSGTKPFNSGSISPDGSTAVLGASEAKQVHLWDLSTARGAVASASSQEAETRLLIDFEQLGGQVWSVRFAPDGRHVLTIGGNDSQLWNIESRRPVLRFSPHGAVASAVMSPDGRLVATGSWDHSVKLWDTETAKAIRKLDGAHAGYVNSVAFSPDGRTLLTASDDGTARLWDVDSGAPIMVLEGHRARVLAACFSPPDGKYILTVSGDKTARVWDRASGALIQEFVGHDWGLLCGQFSPDGMRIITGSQDDTARIWDVQTGNELKRLSGHSAAVTAVAFSPSGTRALTGSQDYTIKLWDANTEKEILSLSGHTQDVTSVSFSPDGLNLLSSSRDGTAIIWLASPWREMDNRSRLAQRLLQHPGN